MSSQLPAPASGPAVVSSPSSVGSAAAPPGLRSILYSLWSFIACLALLWFILINQLRGAWSADPQYSYGWVVPLLMLGLALRRLTASSLVSSPSSLVPGPSSVVRSRSEPAGLRSPVYSLWSFVRSRWSIVSGLAFMATALLLLPTLLILESSPDWRLMNWVLAGEVVLLTLLLLYSYGGSGLVRKFAFPIAYILVAVPWPFTIESPLIQGLTQANASVVIEVLTILGIPAIQHGNLIQVSTGTVGIDEACSGIRSFQSSLMISLFLGEFYRLRPWHRVLLVPLGLLVSFLFNVGRTAILTWIAANKGVAAIAEYHDQAGLTILLACSATLWLIAWLLHRRHLCSLCSLGVNNSASPSAVPNPSSPATGLWSKVYSLRSVSVALLAWLLFVQAGVEAWYRFHERHNASLPSWTLQWPLPKAGFTELPIPPKVSEILGFDEGHSGEWMDAGATWTIYYFRWNPGKQQSWLSGIHRPDVCMASMGHALRQQESRRQIIDAGSIQLPFQLYTYDHAGGVLHVFHCFCEQSSYGNDSRPVEPNKQQRLHAVLAGRRNLGQQTIQVYVRGIPDEVEAGKALASQLQNAIRVTSNQQARASQPPVAP